MKLILLATLYYLHGSEAKKHYLVEVGKDSANNDIDLEEPANNDSLIDNDTEGKDYSDYCDRSDKRSCNPATRIFNPFYKSEHIFGEIKISIKGTDGSPCFTSTSRFGYDDILTTFFCSLEKTQIDNFDLEF